MMRRPRTWVDNAEMVRDDTWRVLALFIGYPTLISDCESIDCFCLMPLSLVVLSISEAVEAIRGRMRTLLR